MSGIVGHLIVESIIIEYVCANPFTLSHPRTKFLHVVEFLEIGRILQPIDPDSKLQDMYHESSREGTPPCCLLLGHEPQFQQSAIPPHTSWHAEAFVNRAADDRGLPSCDVGIGETDILIESIEIRRRVSALLENCIASSALSKPASSAAGGASASPRPDDRQPDNSSSRRASGASGASRGTSSGARPQPWWDEVPAADRSSSPKATPASPGASSATRWWDEVPAARAGEAGAVGAGGLSEGRAYLLELAARLEALDADAAPPPPAAARTSGGGWASTLTGEAELKVRVRGCGGDAERPWARRAFPHCARAPAHVRRGEARLPALLACAGPCT